jgi:hypothetical protein
MAGADASLRSQSRRLRVTRGNRRAQRVLFHVADETEAMIMPAKSKAQQKAAGAALAAKRGEQKVSDLQGPAKSMYESMSEQQLDDFASGKRKGKPEHASKKK